MRSKSRVQIFLFWSLTRNEFLFQKEFPLLWINQVADPKLTATLSQMSNTSNASNKSFTQTEVTVAEVEPRKPFDAYRPNYQWIKTQPFYDLVHNTSSDLHISPLHLLCYTGKFLTMSTEVDKNFSKSS